MIKVTEILGVLASIIIAFLLVTLTVTSVKMQKEKRMNQTIDLRIPDLRKVPIGTIVISSKGFSFELISRDEHGKESWLDVEAKLIWHDIAETNINHYLAMKKYKYQIPRLEQFIEAEEHGFREVLPNMNGYWFWSSTPCPGCEARYAYVFNGYNGSADYYRNRDGSYDSIAARCVSPADAVQK